MHRRFLSVLVAIHALQTFWLASTFAVQPIEAVDDRSASNQGRFITPAPVYPFLVYGDTHEWTARVAFDERGNAFEAVLIRSTGSSQLDNTITNWIKGHWKSFVGKPTTLVTSAK